MNKPMNEPRVDTGDGHSPHTAQRHVSFSAPAFVPGRCLETTFGENECTWGTLASARGRWQWHLWGVTVGKEGVYGEQCGWVGALAGHLRRVQNMHFH